MKHHWILAGSALLVAGTSLAACNDERPRSNRPPHHHRDHDRDRDHHLGDHRDDDRRDWR